MPRCCITKVFLAELQTKAVTRAVNYYDEEIHEFSLEYRGKGRGTWYFRYKKPNRKYYTCSIGSLQTLSLTEARAKAYRLQKIMAEGGDPKETLQRSQSSLTLEHFVTHYYLPAIRLKKRSWSLDQRILRLHILPLFGLHALASIRPMEISQWQIGLRASGLAPSTCNRIFVLFKFLFNCALRWGVLQDSPNPCHGIRLFDDVQTKERYLSPREGCLLVEALNTSPHRQSAQVIQLLLFTGARKSEILAARWEHVDIEGRLLTVPVSKSGKTRYIPLSDAAVQILQRVPRQVNNPWVFPSKKTNSHLCTIFRAWDEVRAHLGLQDVRLHDLRHSFASYLVNAGCSLYEVQCCLGHHDPKVTMRYAHLASKSLVRAANMVENSVGKPLPLPKSLRRCGSAL